MIFTGILVAVLMLAAIVELVVPGSTLYHTGWFNVLLVAAAITIVVRVPRDVKTLTGRHRAGVLVLAAGAIVCAFATVASGLLGPDTETIVAAPGASVHIDALGGALVFPIVESGSQRYADVLLERNGHSVSIAPSRFTGPFLLHTFDREVVSVDVADARGAHLTITQPTGSTFLSPVLLVQSQQQIAGMSLPYDTFAVPAAHRVVKAVVFDAAQASRLPALAGAQHAVLFDVENEREQSVKDGIGVSRDGQPVSLAGLTLSGRVFTYPAVRLISVPDPRIVLAGALVALAGLGLTFYRRSV